MPVAISCMLVCWLMCGDPMCCDKNMLCTPAFVSTVFRFSIQMFMFDASANFSVFHLAFVCCVMWLLLCDWCVVGEGVLMFMFANCCVGGVCCCCVFAAAMVFSLCCVSCCRCCCTCCSFCVMFVCCVMWLLFSVSCVDGGGGGGGRVIIYVVVLCCFLFGVLIVGWVCVCVGDDICGSFVLWYC